MKHYIWGLLWALFVLVIISAPLNTDGTPSFPGMDKLVHTGIFFVFTVLLFFGNMKNNIRPWVLSFPITIIISSGFAFLTELIQKYIFTYRAFEWWDLFADHVGIGMGVFAYLAFIVAQGLPKNQA